ncbi:TrkH family potassium uptake protein [Qingshengfaniella alkalisoli]|uniref:TrkH family potassium uptake protein n=2 Tax=Qingshengfaniella alkalisoli TaxID=2599296 RepID=A0A5B8IX92_9RHOB|nr:TrkH family potassium uptake protein [Qingshengfaniella alkalisoli]
MRAPRVPMFIVMIGITSLAMLLPAAVAAAQGDLETARPFLYAGILFTGIAVLLGLATQSTNRSISARGPLMSLMGAFTVLPILFALPVMEAVQGLSFRNAYFEMVSSATTTGATVFEAGRNVPPAVHLWRALVAWMGGFLIWVAAISILAPLRMGGYEVMLTRAQVNRDVTLGRANIARRPQARSVRFAKQLAPVYGILTLTLWIGLMVAGMTPLNGFCIALSTISTSGIVAGAGLQADGAGFLGEVLIFCFFVFALSRRTFANDLPVFRKWQHDPELQLAALLAIVAPSIMFLHHFFGAVELSNNLGNMLGVRTLWGSIFTSVSFLSTTGFVSDSWSVARNWSGLETPGLLLMGLALVGGGVATTAGGVKLLRVYILYRHGELEMARLIHPHLVDSPRHGSRKVRSKSAHVAWLFFMIFALSVAGVMTAFSLADVDFETGLVLTVASLSNTGPLTRVAGDAPIVLAQLSTPAQAIMCAAMVLGRLEALALIALFNPDFWRS